jgi:hypothetical protein
MFSYLILFALIDKTNAIHYKPALTDMFNECLVPNWGYFVGCVAPVDNVLFHTHTSYTEERAFS